MLSEAEIARRCLLGLGECKIEGDGILSKLEPARNGGYYIPHGVKRFAKYCLPQIKDDADFGKSKMIFASDEKIMIDEVEFKPKKGKKYEFLPLTVDLRGKDYKKTYSIVHGLVRIGKSFCIHAKYIFDKKALLQQMASVFRATRCLTGMGFACYTEDKQTAFIGKTNVTKLLKNRKFAEETLMFLSAIDGDDDRWGWYAICSCLEKKGWIYSDGTAFDKQKVRFECYFFKKG